MKVSTVKSGRVARRAQRLDRLVFVRQANSGRPTFAVARNTGEFPEWELADVPAYVIQGHLDKVAMLKRLRREAWRRGLHISHADLEKAAWYATSDHTRDIFSIAEDIIEDTGASRPWALVLAGASWARMAQRKYYGWTTEENEEEEWDFLSTETLERLRAALQ